jgi:5-oxoprolinase (ATP-hydrolysing)
VCLPTSVYDLASLKAGAVVQGPAIILNQTSTVLIEPQCRCVVDNYGNLEVDLSDVEAVKA